MDVKTKNMFYKRANSDGCTVKKNCLKRLVKSHSYHYCVLHSYLTYPGYPGQGTAHNFEMSITLNHTRLKGEGPENPAYDITVSTKNGKGVVIFLLKRTHSVAVRLTSP